jgi:uncharacterized protein YdaT
MPWTKKNYPDSMKNMPVKVREKAIEIANVLLEEENMEEGIAIATAISRSRDWAAERGLHYKNREDSRLTDVKKHGRDRYVIPHDEGWAIKVEGHTNPERLFGTKLEAVQEARKETKKVNGTLTIQKKTGRVEKRVSYNPRNSGKRPVSRKKERP